ncbi:hypothetical protein GCM10010199_43100 [Dactylosporangium roseum]
MRQHQPVTPDPAATPADDPAPDASEEADGVAEAAPTSPAPVTAKPHPPIPRPPLHPPVPTSGAPAAPGAAGGHPAPQTAAGSDPATRPGPIGEQAARPAPAGADGPGDTSGAVRATGEPTPAAGTETSDGEPPRPTPHHLAELSGAFAMTASVHDPEAADHEPQPARAGRDDDHDADHHHHHEPNHHHHDEVVSERGLRGLVGGGASQVGVSAAMRARDAARPTDEDLAAAERDLQIIRRGWVPREELARPGRRSPTG